MELYRISQSEKGVGKAYFQLMDKLSAHVTLLARNGKPITSLMGVKRGLFRFKRQLALTPLPSASPLDPYGLPLVVRGEYAPINQQLVVLVGDVLDKLDMDVMEAVEVGLVGERDLKRVLIKYDYGQLVRQGVKHKDIKQQLGEQYGWSVSSIEKLVYRKNPSVLRTSPLEKRGELPALKLGEVKKKLDDVSERK